jgi:ankyrin repeat protein
MLALLLENFKLASALYEHGFSDRYHKNANGESVYDIAMKLSLTNVQKHLVEVDKNRNEDEIEFSELGETNDK